MAKPTRATSRIHSTSFSNSSLHVAYLGFALRAAALKPRAPNWPNIPVSRNIVEAIRYSFDSIDASTEYAYHLTRSGIDGDPRPHNWLTGFIDRQWKTLSLPERMGLLSFSYEGRAFWDSDDQFRLFDHLRHLRNALTHPSLFGKYTEAEFDDFDSPPARSKTTVSGKMKASGKMLAGFAEHPEDLGAEDAKRAVEIALLHALRFERMFKAKNTVLFGAVNHRTSVKQSAETFLRRRKRYFAAIWS